MWNDLTSGSPVSYHGSGVSDSRSTVRQWESSNDVLLNEQPDINLGNNRFKRRPRVKGAKENISNTYSLCEHWFIGFAAISRRPCCTHKTADRAEQHFIRTNTLTILNLSYFSGWNSVQMNRIHDFAIFEIEHVYLSIFN